MGAYAWSPDVADLCKDHAKSAPTILQSISKTLKNTSQPLPLMSGLTIDSRMISTIKDAGVNMMYSTSSSVDARYTASSPSIAVDPLTSDSHMLVNNAMARVLIAASAT